MGGSQPRGLWLGEARRGGSGATGQRQEVAWSASKTAAATRDARQPCVRSASSAGGISGWRWAWSTNSASRSRLPSSKRIRSASRGSMATGGAVGSAPRVVLPRPRGGREPRLGAGGQLCAHDRCPPEQLHEAVRGAGEEQAHELGVVLGGSELGDGQWARVRRSNPSEGGLQRRALSVAMSSSPPRVKARACPCRAPGRTWLRANRLRTRDASGVFQDASSRLALGPERRRRARGLGRRGLRAHRGWRRPVRQVGRCLGSATGAARAGCR